MNQPQIPFEIQISNSATVFNIQKIIITNISKGGYRHIEFGFTTDILHGRGHNKIETSLWVQVCSRTVS